MATLTATGHKLIVEDRRYEDYKSMKQWFHNSHVKEILFSGSQLMTAASVVVDGSDQTIGAQKTTAACVFLSTLADDSLQDLKSVWCVYQDNTGAIHGPIEHVLNDMADTSIVAPMGNEDVFDTCASVAGDVITMTGMAATENQYADWYTVGRSGNGDQIGVANLIISNTAHGTTPAFTLTDTPDANTATDVIQFQQYPCNDFYRMREMYCEVEVIDSFPILLSTFDTGIIYAAIGEGHRYMCNSGFFTQPAATCRSFLGRVKASTAIDSTVTETTGSRITVYYTPLQAHANGGAVETEIDLDFQDTLCWEPCIELQPATDVVIKAMNIEGAKLPNMLIETSYLEVYPS